MTKLRKKIIIIKFSCRAKNCEPPLNKILMDKKPSLRDKLMTCILCKDLIITKLP
jgi:hypothetical protein